MLYYITDTHTLSITVCGQVDSSVLQSAAHFVVGGRPAPDGAWPWMAGVYYLGQYRCGGVLIDDQVTFAFFLTSSPSLPCLSVNYCTGCVTA